jgi:glutamine amidotransferase
MIAILDYGIGNIRSVQNAFDYLGIPAVVTRDPQQIAASDGLVLPGVGAFGEGMKRMEAYAMRPQLDTAIKSGKPLLGICLGFELLMRSSTELGQHAGLGAFPLDVVRLPAKARLPHIGWSEVHTAKEAPMPSRLMQGMEGEHFYFVHSYGVVQAGKAFITAAAHYGGCELVALIEQNNIFGTQFHPEKSGEAGLQLLRNFSALTK